MPGKRYEGCEGQVCQGKVGVGGDRVGEICAGAGTCELWGCSDRKKTVTQVTL